MRGEGRHDLHANDISNTHAHKESRTLIRTHSTTHTPRKTHTPDTHTDKCKANSLCLTHMVSQRFRFLGMEYINVPPCEWHRATQLLCLLSYVTQCHSYETVSNASGTSLTCQPVSPKNSPLTRLYLSSKRRLNYGTFSLPEDNQRSDACGKPDQSTKYQGKG